MFVEPVDRAGGTIVAGLEGAMLIARPYHDTAVLDGVIDRLLADYRTHARDLPDAKL